MLAEVVTLLGASAATEVRDDVFAEVAGWTINDEKGGCTSSAIYDRDVYVSLKFDYSDSTARLVISDPAWRSIEDDVRYKITLNFSNGSEWKDATARGIVTESGRRGLLFWLNSDYFLTDFGVSGALSLSMAGVKLGVINLSGSSAMTARLRSCSIQSFKANPPDPFAPLKERSEFIANFGNLFTSADYPEAALSSKATGKTTVRIKLGSDGKVSDCIIVQSSGHGSLDEATCSVAKSRFVPPLNRDRSRSEFTGSVNWSIPPSG